MVWSVGLFASLIVLNALCAFGWTWLWHKTKKQPEQRNLFARILTAKLLLIFAALLTLPSDPPFQPDQALGIGLLAIAFGSSLSLWLSEVRGKLWLGYIGTFLPFVIPIAFHSSNPFPSLLGLLAGNVLFWFCLGEIWLNRALTVISLVASIGLARLHGAPEGMERKVWQALPAIWAIAGWFGISMVQSWQKYWRSVTEGIVNFVIPSVSLLIGSAIVGFWTNDWRFSILTALTCFAALTAIQTEMTNLQDLNVLLWIGLLVITFATMPFANEFRLLGGYGAALASLILAWLTLSQVESRKVLVQGATLTATFALFRFFAEVHPLRMPRADLYTHYTFVGFLLGATLPFLLMRWMERRQNITRNLEVGFWSAVMPIASILRN